MFRLIIAASLVSLTAADAQQTDGRRVRDSAGVRIVELDSLPAARVAHRMADAPAIVLSIPDGRGNSGSRSGIRLSDGRIVALAGPGGLAATVAQAFDSAGRPLGPFGALREPVALCPMTADSVMVWHRPYPLPAANQPRYEAYSVLSPSGTLVRQMRVPASTRPLCPMTGSLFVFPTPAGFGPVSPVAPGALRTPAPPVVPEEVRRASVRVFHLAPDSVARVVDSLGPFPGIESYPVALRAQAGGYVVSTRARRFGATGSAAVEGDRVHLGDGARWEVRTLDATGRVVQILRVLTPLTPVTPALRTAFIAGSYAVSGRCTPFQEYDETTRKDGDYTWSPTVPAYDRVMTDRVGRLWVRDFAMPDADSIRYRLFTRDARYLGSLSLPNSFTIEDAGADYVLGNMVTLRGRPPCIDVIRPENRSTVEFRLYRLGPGT
jgi:hypothetical protein